MAVWEGHYATYESAAGAQQNHIHPRWIEKSISRMESAQSGNISSDLTSSGYELLAGSIAGLSSFQAQISVLDIGGALGHTGIMIRHALAGACRLEWWVLERGDFLRECRSKTELPGDINFLIDTVEEADLKVDVVYFGSSLQYFAKPLQYVQKISETFRPNILIVTDALVDPNISSFCTRQRYFESYMVCWFLNLDDLSSALSRTGMELSLSMPARLSVERGYMPITGLVPDQTLEHSLDLCYVRRALG